MLVRASFYEASARSRIRQFLDKNSFTELCPPSEKIMSPHLKSLGVAASFDDGVVVGEGLLDGEKVLVAAQEGGFMGGAVGEVHGAKLCGLLNRALEVMPAAVVLMLDTGGVRLHEANAGLIAVGEIQRAILELRLREIPTIAIIGGRNGCYGGMSIAVQCCDWIIASEEGRISISGPEVIEAVEGVEEFDSQDRALIWRTMGAKHRALMGDIDFLVEDDIEVFKNTAKLLLNKSKKIDLEYLKKENDELNKRLLSYEDCQDAYDVWEKKGFNDFKSIPDISVSLFNNKYMNKI